MRKFALQTQRLVCDLALGQQLLSSGTNMRDPALGPGWILVGAQLELASSHRHVVGLRSWRTGEHESLLIYRQDPLPSSISLDEAPRERARYYALVNECPHMGLPLEGALLRLFTDLLRCLSPC